MPTAPLGDDLWMTPGIRRFFRMLRLKFRMLLSRFFDLRNHLPLQSGPEGNREKVGTNRGLYFTPSGV
jgi:hypothetical protein